MKTNWIIGGVIAEIFIMILISWVSISLYKHNADYKLAYYQGDKLLQYDFLPYPETTSSGDVKQEAADAYGDRICGKAVGRGYISLLNGKGLPIRIAVVCGEIRK